MNYYEQIRKACIARNPEIMELNFWCEILTVVDIQTRRVIKGIIVWKDDENPDIVYVYRPTINFSSALNTRMEMNENKILWRPLTLSDVLFTHFLKEQHSPPFVWTEFSRLLLEIWDYSKSVENQPIETLKFICENLPTNL